MHCVRPSAEGRIVIIKSFSDPFRDSFFSLDFLYLVDEIDVAARNKIRSIWNGQNEAVIIIIVPNRNCSWGVAEFRRQMTTTNLLEGFTWLSPVINSPFFQSRFVKGPNRFKLLPTRKHEKTSCTKSHKRFFRIFVPFRLSKCAFEWFVLRLNFPSRWPNIIFFFFRRGKKCRKLSGKCFVNRDNCVWRFESFIDY